MTVAHFHARRRASGLPAVLRTATTCTPSETTGCINGILQDPSRNPIAGVTVTLDGAESATATTGPGTARGVSRHAHYHETAQKERVDFPRIVL